ncbi:hypothetical protein [Agromyces larvae]|uniref:Uncharacterized protein n=1 Tax=Agromyces larvae TaxID=2929802 RepID=A0ABY4C6A0_9MICO|nr:hypothetical protein [Agromyces larvae]UOE45947.1 hypothetical protein MTO99_09460 [Agromyces larvae]
MLSTRPTFTIGQAVFFDGMPALILDVRPDQSGMNVGDGLTISTYPGMLGYIGSHHSQLDPLEESTLSRPFAARLADIRAYYKIGA